MNDRFHPAQRLRSTGQQVGRQISHEISRPIGLIWRAQHLVASKLTLRWRTSIARTVLLVCFGGGESLARLAAQLRTDIPVAAVEDEGAALFTRTTRFPQKKFR